METHQRGSAVRDNLAQRIEPEVVENSQQKIAYQKTSDPLDEILNRKTKRTHVREFSQIFALIFFGITLYLLWKNYSFASALACTFTGLALIVIGYWVPRALLKVWESWMMLGMAMGMVVTTVLMSIVWIIMMIPISILLRIMRIRVMDTTYGLPVETYWMNIDPAKTDFKLLERQF